MSMLNLRTVEQEEQHYSSFDQGRSYERATLLRLLRTAPGTGTASEFAAWLEKQLKGK